ncbi:helix-turn-helix domain-containing protein [Ponticoccus alexandrii]|uniref:Helix-turn-helix transcriptional regulator n=1 Tax=Ponticoccus alexandrii TaxID=1943633 RepID=A0ABX7F8B6_9RHOB|nr:helix-turn-helix transcriptional regulator [Ponticoccus alexandrii]ETA53990.1 hypothetical protein P279_00235 [Rhodobacteraceae bacterium PD-2]QRF66359.1 hypothetical protein GQA70_08580 [Ponticoccus alexandrii]
MQTEIAKIEGRLCRAGQTVAELCRRAAIARSTWQRWKRGDTEPNMATWLTVQAACDGLCGPVVDGPAEDAA